jgi:hypothetical protein
MPLQGCGSIKRADCEQVRGSMCVHDDGFRRRKALAEKDINEEDLSPEREGMDTEGVQRAREAERELQGGGGDENIMDDILAESEDAPDSEAMPDERKDAGDQRPPRL